MNSVGKLIILAFWSVSEDIIWLVENDISLTSVGTDIGERCSIGSFAQCVEPLTLIGMCISSILILLFARFVSPSRIIFLILSIAWFECCAVYLIYIEWYTKILVENDYKIRYFATTESHPNPIFITSSKYTHWPVTQLISEFYYYLFILLFSVFSCFKPLISSNVNNSNDNNNNNKENNSNRILQILLLCCICYEVWLCCWDVTYFDETTINYCGIIWLVNKLMIINIIIYFLLQYQANYLIAMKSKSNVPVPIGYPNLTKVQVEQHVLKQNESNDDYQPMINPLMEEVELIVNENWSEWNMQDTNLPDPYMVELVNIKLLQSLFLLFILSTFVFGLYGNIMIVMNQSYNHNQHTPTWGKGWINDGNITLIIGYFTYHLKHLLILFIMFIVLSVDVVYYQIKTNYLFKYQISFKQLLYLQCNLIEFRPMRIFLFVYSYIISFFSLNLV